MRTCAAFCLLACLAAALPAPAQEHVPTTPTARPDGGPWRIASCQGGEYKDYLPVLQAILENLLAVGWITADTDQCFPRNQTARKAWSCLAEQASGPYLRFVKDAFWDAGWDDARRRKNREDALQYLADDPPVDLVVAMGAWASQDLAVDDHGVPTLVASTSNPLTAGIIDSPQDFGLDLVHARVEPAVADEPPGPEPAAVPAGVRGKRILVAEDNPLNAELLLHHTASIGCDPVLAENGEKPCRPCRSSASTPCSWTWKCRASTAWTPPGASGPASPESIPRTSPSWRSRPTPCPSTGSSAGRRAWTPIWPSPSAATS
jgi:hypothetical protein